MEAQEKLSERFPLRLTPRMDAEIRALARGDGERPPSGINDTILQLIEESLRARREKEQRQAKQEAEPGNKMPSPLAALGTR